MLNLSSFKIVFLMSFPTKDLCLLIKYFFQILPCVFKLSIILETFMHTLKVVGCAVYPVI